MPRFLCFLQSLCQVNYPWFSIYSRFNVITETECVYLTMYRIRIIEWFMILFLSYPTLSTLCALVELGYCMSNSWCFLTGNFTRVFVWLRRWKRNISGWPCIWTWLNTWPFNGVSQVRFICQLVSIYYFCCWCLFLSYNGLFSRNQDIFFNGRNECIERSSKVVSNKLSEYSSIMLLPN